MPTATSLGLPDVRGRLPLLAGLAIDSFGAGIAAPLLLLFFTRVADIPLGTAGVALSVANLFTLVAPAVVGQVIDRIGPRNLIIGSQVAQAVAFAGLLFARSLGLLFFCALVASMGQRVFWSSIFSLLSDISTPVDRDRWFGLSGMMQATGFGLGTLAAGMLLTFHGSAPFLIAMAVNAISFVVAGFLLSRIHVDHDPKAAAENGPAPLLRRDRPFLILIAANTVLALCMMLLGVGLPVYVAEALPVPVWLVGVLMATVSVVLATGQTLVVRHTENRRRTLVLVVAAGLWALWGLVMSSLLHVPTALVVPALIVATLIFAAADVLHAATSNALAAAAAPVIGRGKYLSYWQYSFTLAGAIAPAFFAQLFDRSPELPWLGISLLAVLAGLTILILERVLPTEAVRRPAPAADQAD
ncbi:MFS transporter [Kribbella deserti]|uniref:MFS transporter n=1 Tax=Kribbella deserti TaxID=1926257 RepID=A0ABV6QUD0_9ACTN